MRIYSFSNTLIIVCKIQFLREVLILKDLLIVERKKIADLKVKFTIDEFDKIYS